MTASDYAGLIGGVGGVAGAIVGIFAAIAAWRSAGSARSATELAARQIELAARQARESLLREANTLAHRAVLSAGYVKQRAEGLQQVYASLLALCGVRMDQIASTRAVGDRAESKAARAAAIAAEAECLRSNLDTKSEAELTEVLRQIDQFATELAVMKEAISDELSEYQGENRLRRREIATLHAATITAQPPGG